MGCRRSNRQRAAADHAVALRALAAAVVVISTSAGLWSYFELQRSRLEIERVTELARRSAHETAGLQREVDRLAQPHSNVVVADVFPPDAARGERESAGEQTIVVPANARLFTVILNSNDAAPPGSTGYTLDVLGDNGSRVWRGEGLQRSRFGTFTVALPRTLLPAWVYCLVLRMADPRGCADRLEDRSRVSPSHPLRVAAACSSPASGTCRRAETAAETSALQSVHMPRWFSTRAAVCAVCVGFTTIGMPLAQVDDAAKRARTLLEQGKKELAAGQYSEAVKTLSAAAGLNRSLDNPVGEA